MNDSLSSLSIESADDEDNLLHQAISVGAKTLTKSLQLRSDANDSYSSIDSCDSLDHQSQSLLDQVVQSGISKITKKQTPSTSKKQNLPIRDRDRSDDELLQQAINTGITKTTGQTPKTSSQPVVISKNVMNSTTAPVLPSAIITGSDVEEIQKVQIKGTNEFVNEVFHHQQQIAAQNGSKMTASNASMQSLMYKSNEYPAFKLSEYEFNDITHTDSIMEISNEFMATNNTDSCSFTDKRKNPDLMLKSVDRLTQELVATAEFLRQTDPNCIRIAKDRKGSSSNHTWNEDSVSFPSISIDIPNMNVSQIEDDNTFNDLKSSYSNNFCVIEEQTPTNEVRSFSEKVSGQKSFDDNILKEASFEATLRYDEIDGPESMDTVRNEFESLSEGIFFNFKNKT